jgi:precorrin-2 dehydrogenase/sirohydrochlorin ferrochelatase
VNYYPVFLNLESKKVVVIGGGSVTARKITSLLKARADVTVVSPRLTKVLLAEKRKKRIRHINRSYAKKDLAGAFLVIAATDSQTINAKVAQDSPALVNVVDVPSECNFIAPSVIKRGPLMVAISTSGTSPALSKAIRKEVEQLYGPDFSLFLSFVKKVRAKALVEIKEKRKRELFLKSLGSEKMLKTLRRNGMGVVRKKVLEHLIKVKK